MPFCSNCGKEISPTDKFCPSCGFNLRYQPQVLQVAPSTEPILGLGRNAAVFLSQSGLTGVQLQSGVLLFLCFIAPIFPLVLLFSLTQTGTLAVYFTIWLASSLVLYDELKWRGLRKIQQNSANSMDRIKAQWRLSWSSIRLADWNGKTLWFSSANPPRKGSVTFNPSDASLVEQNLGLWGVMFSRRQPKLPSFLTTFSALALLLFIVSQVILISAATLPFFPGESQTYTTLLNSTRSQVSNGTFIGDFRDIFVNNVQVAWGGAIPFFGAFAFGVASYNTGRVIQIIAADASVKPSLVLLTLYLFPHTWIEESAYPIATVSGILAITRWRTVPPEAFRRILNRGSTKFVLAMGGVVTILFIAGIIETFGIFAGLDETIVWIPIGILVYYFLAKRRKQKRIQLQIGSP